MIEKDEPCPEGGTHEWERHNQPIPVLRACGWSCKKCDKRALFIRGLNAADKT